MALSEDQAKVYDRQLRVWGVEVQKRLTQANVLIVGFSGVAAEVAKNVVLAGVGNVHIMDSTPCSKYSQPSFLITTDAAETEQSVAEAACKVLQAMNPLVNVSAHPGSVSDITSPEALKGFDLVFVTQQPLSSMRRLDELASAAGVKYMAAAVVGAHSYFFLNLHSHTYMPKAEPSQAKKPEAQTLQYVPLQQALAAPLSRLNKRSHPLYPVLRVLAAFEEAHGRQATPADAAGLQQQAAQLEEADGVKPGTVRVELLQDLVSDTEEFAPACAVLGGIIANNVIKSISSTGEPVFNMVLYSVADGLGAVEQMT